MHIERFPSYQKEVPELTHTTPPATETLLKPETTYSPWPEFIRNNSKLREHAQTRKELLNELNSVFKKIPKPDTDIFDALKQEKTLEDNIQRFYESIARFLEQDTENADIILYLPFELFPKNPEQLKDFPSIQKTINQHIPVFMQAWSHLLTQKHFRADFLDGDIPEPEHRLHTPPEVVKAAHLIPTLVCRGLLIMDDVITLMENASDEVLAESIADTLPVLLDMSVLNEKHMERLSHSKSKLASNMAIILKNYQKQPNREEQSSPSNIQTILSEYVEHAHKQNNQSSHLSARERWLQSVSEEKIRNQRAYDIAGRLSSGSENIEDLRHALETVSLRDIQPLVMESMRMELVHLSQTDIQSSRERYDSYKPIIDEIQKETPPTEQEPFQKLLFHLASCGILEEQDLSFYGLHVPKIDASFESQTTDMEDASRLAKMLLEEFRNHLDISQKTYPILMLIGSRMKGYAKKDADFDTAIFIKPETHEDDRKNLQEAFENIFQKHGVNGSVMEFWLQEEGDALWIRDYINPDPHRGDSSLVHPILGAWYGELSTMKELYEKLMPHYLYSENKTILHEDARRVWIDTMEHDLLQYRLMHKGYREFFHPQGGLGAEHSDGMEGESVFYDSGYRRLATKIFLKKIFLPQLKKTVSEK